MASERNLIDSYEQLMTVSQKVLQSGHCEAAFHALQAALHCAKALKDEQCLIAVQREAERQHDFINNRSPAHRMSTRSAQQRAGTDLYEILIRQSSVHINRIQHERRQANMTNLPSVWNT
jgi:hypothetical protein